MILPDTVENSSATSWLHDYLSEQLGVEGAYGTFYDDDNPHSVHHEDGHTTMLYHPTVEVDPLAFEQVLSNITSWATDFVAKNTPKVSQELEMSPSATPNPG